MKGTALPPRAEELLVERALRPLDDGELADLDALGAAGDASFEAAAAAVVLATTPIAELPPELAERIAASAPRPDVQRTLAGVMATPPGGGVPRDPIVGVELSSLAPPPATAPSAPSPRDELAARRERSHIRLLAPWLVAAACLLVASGAVWVAMRDRGTVTAQSPAAARASLVASAGDAATIAWKATDDPNARGATGDVVWSATEQRGYMRFVGLAPNDPTQFQYQLWIFDNDRDERFPVDGGVFDVTSTGEIVVPIAAKLRVGEAKLFAVTIEKPGGVVVSKRERIVVTAARS